MFALRGDAAELAQPDAGLPRLPALPGLPQRCVSVQCESLTALGARRLLDALSDATSPLRVLLRDGGVQRLVCPSRPGSLVAAPGACGSGVQGGVQGGVCIDAPDLRVLRLNGLRIKAPPDLRRCPKLEEISLRDNLIGPEMPPAAEWLVPWPDAPDELTPRIALDLAYNCLRAVRDWPATFPPAQVVSIDLSYNTLTELPPPQRRGSVNMTENNIPHRNAVLFALDPTTGLWVDPVTGEVERTVGVREQVGRLLGRNAGPTAAPVPADAAASATPKRTVYSSTQTVHASSVQQGVRASVGAVLAAARAAGGGGGSGGGGGGGGLGEALRGAVLAAARAVGMGGGCGGDLEEALRGLAKVGSASGDALTMRSVRELCADTRTVFFYDGEGSVTYPALLAEAWRLATALDAAHGGGDAVQRLWQEVRDGVAMCFTGRVSRIVNAFVGIVDGVCIGVSPREQLQARAQALMRRQRAAADADAGLPTLAEDWAREEEEAAAEGGEEAVGALKDRRDELRSTQPPSERDVPAHGPAVRALRRELVGALHDASEVTLHDASEVTQPEHDAWLEAFDEAFLFPA